MFFASDAPSPYDLHFRLLGFPVRVQPWFWIVMAVLGWNVTDRMGFEYLLVWVACGFVSILVHELGHALAYRAFGEWAAITLHGFGGQAQGSGSPRHAWQRLTVSAAGPLAGFALVGALFASTLGVDWPRHNTQLGAVYTFLMLQGIFWNLFNLLPVWPMDGGRIAREVFAMVRLRSPDHLMHAVSVGVAGLLTLLGVASYLRLPVPLLNDMPWWFYVPGPMGTVWLGLLAYQNYQMMQAYQAQNRFYRDHDDDDYYRGRR